MFLRKKTAEPQRPRHRLPLVHKPVHQKMKVAFQMMHRVPFRRVPFENHQLRRLDPKNGFLARVETHLLRTRIKRRVPQFAFTAHSHAEFPEQNEPESFPKRAIHGELRNIREHFQRVDQRVFGKGEIVGVFETQQSEANIRRLEKNGARAEVELARETLGPRAEEDRVDRVDQRLLRVHVHLVEGLEGLGYRELGKHCNYSLWLGVFCRGAWDYNGS